MAGEDSQGLDEPVIEGPVYVKFECADGVGDMLDGVALAVGVVVHGIDAPFVACTVMMCVFDAIEDRVAEHHVGMCHVYLGAEHLLAVGVLAVTHFTEDTQVLFGGAVPPGALLAGSFHCAAPCADFLLCLVVNVCKAALYQLFGPFVELVEVVGCVKLLLPLEAEPLDVFFDGVDIFGIFFGGVGIVVAEIGLAAIFLCESEVYAEAFGVPQMQIAVRLRREAGKYAVYLAGLQVILDDFLEEIEFSFFFHCLLLY